MVADGLPFYVRRWTLWMASRKLIIMNKYSQTGGSNAFLRVFSCAGVLAVLLLCAGTAAGATWVVDDGGADYASMQTAEAAA